MISFIIAVFVILAVIVGRYALGTWMNHISIYSILWGFSLLLFEARLIEYYPLEPETWLLIFAAWLSFILGAITIPAIRYSIMTQCKIPQSTASDIAVQIESESRILIIIIWICIGITGIHAIYQTILALRLMGSFSNIIIFGNLLYSYRVSEGVPGSVPYIGHIALTASCLGGAYTGLIGRLRPFALIPLLIVLVEAIVNMGRATMIIASILFLSGYMLNKTRLTSLRGNIMRGRVRRIVVPLFVMLVVMGGAEAVRSSRGTIESFPGETSSLRNLRGDLFITPSIYLYATVHHGVFNTYLKTNGEHVQFGYYTFAPFWRLFAKLGFDTQVPQYQSYYRTPVGANTGTYLRELDADFGVAGVVIVPYLMGMATSWLLGRFKLSGKMTDLIILCHVYVLIVMSLFVMATQLGYWWVSLLTGIALGVLIDGRLKVEATAGNLAGVRI